MRGGTQSSQSPMSTSTRPRRAHRLAVDITECFLHLVSQPQRTSVVRARVPFLAKVRVKFALNRHGPAQAVLMRLHSPVGLVRPAQ